MPDDVLSWNRLRWGLCSVRHFILLFFLPLCFGQTANTDTYLPHDLSASFRYEAKLGANSYASGNAPGFGVRYSYRPLRWLEFEAGLDQIVRPIGASVCCEHETNANDELYLVPFGARYVWEPAGKRLRLSLGGGGAYMNHSIGHENTAEGLVSASGWGGQAVASGDFALTHSARLRAGVTARYYYIHVGPYTTAREIAIGPDFTFSFR